jgi:hypothetical protein
MDTKKWFLITKEGCPTHGFPTREGAQSFINRWEATTSEPLRFGWVINEVAVEDIANF